MISRVIRPAPKGTTVKATKRPFLNIVTDVTPAPKSIKTAPCLSAGVSTKSAKANGATIIPAIGNLIRSAIFVMIERRIVG